MDTNDEPQGPQLPDERHAFYSPQQPSYGYPQQSGQPVPGYPPPMLPKKKAWYKRPWGIVLIILLSLGICGAITNTGTKGASSTSTTANTSVATQAPTPTDTPEPTDTPTPEPSLAYKLATIDSGGYVADGDTSITRFQYLLDTLHQKTGDTEQQIADETVAGQNITHDKYGKDVKLIDLMENVNSAITADEHVHYADALAAYITLAYS